MIENGVTKHDDYLSAAPPETLPGVLARVAHDRKRWLTRTALARFYRWKKCKRLAPSRKRRLS